NAGFEQSTYNHAQAGAEVVAAATGGPASNLNYDHLAVDTSQPGGVANNDTWADRRYARRTIEIGNIFQQVWIAGGQANPINTRVRPVLDSQVANLSRFNNMLAYVSSQYGAPSNFFYGIGVAPYIN